MRVSRRRISPSILSSVPVISMMSESGATSLLVSTQQPEALRALAEIAL